MDDSSIAAQSTPAPSAPAPRRRRRWLKRLLYLAYLAIVLEIGLQSFYFFTVGQWLPSRVNVPMYAPNEHSEYFNKANLSIPHNSNEFQTMIYTNGQGLRTSAEAADYPLGKQPGKKRILLLGPSFAFGWGVKYEQTFAAQLEEMLRDSAEFGSDVEVINAGVPSLGLVQGLNWYRHVGKKFEPDLVIQFNTGSMNVDSSGRWNNVEINEQGYLIRKDATAKQRLIGYAKNSALVYYGWQAVTRIMSLFHQPKPGDKIEGAGREMELHEAFQPDNPEVLDSMKYYEDLRSTVELSGAKLLVLFMPMSYCVHEQDISRWAHLDTVDIERQNQYNAAFCRHLQSVGFDCLDVTDDSKQAAAGGQRLYYFIDIHWTPEGNQVAARAAARHLKEPP
ncbi:MAG: hypothetical protein WD894_14130 [Pirellulales bacterium]